MNSYEKEVIKAQLEAEKKALFRLKAIYERAAKDVSEKLEISNGKIEILLEDIDKADEQTKSILQSQIYQRDFQKNLKLQIDKLLEDFNDRQFETISEYLNGTYDNGFIGTLYDLNMNDIPVIVPINPAMAERAMSIDSKISKPLYEKLGEDVEYLKKRIANNIARGISTASLYRDIARNIESNFNTGFNRAMRIVRTESSRIYNAATLDSAIAAKDKTGADLVKVWDATLDGITRPHHRQLNGQVRELDKDFEVDTLTASAPGHFGIAKEDINCRCVCFTKPRWDLEGTFIKRNNENDELLEFQGVKDYEDFKKKYWNAVDNSIGSGIIKSEQKIFSESDYKTFSNGDEVNNFFYYDGEERGLKARRNSKHSQWMKSLSNDEREAVNWYASNGYGDINDYWRKQDGWEYINADTIKQESKHLDTAISRYALKDNITVQRGTMENALDQLFEKYETYDDYSGWIGKKYIEQGYMSTTVLNNNPVATAKPVIFNIWVPAGQGLGAYINEPSLTDFCDTEYEFLIKRNSTFTIIDVKEDIEAGKFIIDMRLDI